jgi:curli biogenesis system outer membrane secretion channel CsgG
MKTSDLKVRLFALGVVMLIAGCATVRTQTNVAENKNEQVTPSDYTGPKKRLQVVHIGIPENITRQYPELAEKKVGWGLANRLVEAFYDTKRFTFIEEKEEILNKMVENWKLSQSGLVSDQTAVQPGQLNAPEYLVYAEVYDFSVSSQETVVAAASTERKTTRIGVQIRLVNVSTGEYVPASGIGEEAVTKDSFLWGATKEDFDQSTVGKASQLAINTAVNQLLRRL